MKITVSWKDFLLFANLGLLIATIVAGHWLYAGALGRSDALPVFNPCPLVTIADNIAYYPVNPFPNIQPRSGHVVANLFEYVRDWYFGFNGRLSVGILNSLIAQAAKWWAATPESFPWWLMRALSLFCILATPLNLMVAVGWAWAKRPGRTLTLLAAIWAVWIVSPKIYIFTVVYDVLLTDRNIHEYVLAWMIIGVINNWMGRAVWKWSLLAAGILFLGSEQNLFSVPILLMAAAWIGSADHSGAGRSWRWQAIYYSAWTCLSAAIYFLSPGQRLRNNFLMMQTIGDFSPLEWYRQVVTLGYGALVPRLPDALWIWHLAWYGGLGLVLATWLIVRLKSRAPDRLAVDRPSGQLFGIGLMAFAFFTAFLASMATLVVSPYFPPYAIYYPSLLLVLGLAFSFWLVLDCAVIGLEALAASGCCACAAGMRRAGGWLRLACVAGLPLLLTGTLIGTVTVRAWPSLVAEYRQVMEQDGKRRRLYAEIVRLRNTTDQRRFVLANLWSYPIWGIHMDEPWAMAAYFRWRRMEDVVCVAESEWIAAGRPQAQLYLKLDCAKILAEGLQYTGQP